MKIPALLCATLLCYSNFVQAQLCTGSLGDPVVFINFGTGSGPGGALPPNTTTYNYSGNSCPNDGQYSITDLTSDCFGGSWHTLSEDHTPNDVLGRFMLVNASFQPGDFYLDTIRGLCPSTNYEFAAWVKNVLKPEACNGSGIKPNLTFRIESLTGTVLTTFNSGDIDAQAIATWKQYGAYFITPTGVSDVVIRLTNNAPGGCGNDLALEDITFRPCGPKVNAIVNSTGTPELFACEKERKDYLLTVTYSPGVYVNPSFQWQESTDNGLSWQNIPGANSNTYLRVASGLGVYLYRTLIADGPANINSITCRLASNIITIRVIQADVQLVPQVVGCSGRDIPFTASGGVSYSWSGPNGFSASVQSPVVSNAQLSNSGWYKVAIIDEHGCTDEDSTILQVNPSPTAIVSPEAGICEGGSVQISVSGGVSYLWVPASGLSSNTINNPFANPTDTTIYTAFAFNQFGCFDTGSVIVNVWKKPLANAGPDKKIIKGYQVSIAGTVQGSDIHYYWTPPYQIADPNALKTTVNPVQNTTYTLHAESNRGCGSHTDDMYVKVYDKLLIPNAFSPNGDGINDSWVIEPLDFFSQSLTSIFNRYGQTIYTSKGYSKPWDGTYNGNPVPVGMYYYVIDLKTNNEPPLTGSVLVIR